jgi:cation:H+ antiporter
MNVLWIKFIICALLILISGKKVAKYADVISEKTGISRLLIGVILVAIATSLPELFTGVGSILFVNAPDLTIGNIFGANSYNLLNIGLMDIFYRGSTPLLSSLSQGDIVMAALSLVPLLIATLGIILSQVGLKVPSFFNIGIFSIFIFISYIIVMKFIYNLHKKNIKKMGTDRLYDSISVKKAFISYALAAIIIVISGIWLAYIGRDIAEVLNLNRSFTGSLFMGLVTTLPEITVSIAALLMGAKEIAIANMLGSNLFNMTIIFIDDILYRKGPILSVVSKNNILTASVVAIMTAVIIVAMVIKEKKKILGISWYVPVLCIIFILGAYFNFTIGVK